MQDHKKKEKKGHFFVGLPVFPRAAGVAEEDTIGSSEEEGGFYFPELGLGSVVESNDVPC